MEAKEQQIQLMEKAEIENIQKELMEKNIKAEIVQEMQDYFNNVVEEEEMDIMGGGYGIDGEAGGGGGGSNYCLAKICSTKDINNEGVYSGYKIYFETINDISNK